MWPWGLPSFGGSPTRRGRGLYHCVGCSSPLPRGAPALPVPLRFSGRPLYAFQTRRAIPRSTACRHAHARSAGCGENEGEPHCVHCRRGVAAAAAAWLLQRAPFPNRREGGFTATHVAGSGSFLDGRPTVVPSRPAPPRRTSWQGDHSRALAEAEPSLPLFSDVGAEHPVVGYTGLLHALENVARDAPHSHPPPPGRAPPPPPPSPSASSPSSAEASAWERTHGTRRWTRWKTRPLM